MKTGAALAQGMRRLREKLGMTQAQLAERVGVHEQFISQLERQQRSPRLSTVDALAAAFGVAPWELLRAGAEKAAPPARRDALAHRLRAVVESWPEADHDRLLGVLAELGRLASRRASPRRARSRRA